MFGSEVTLVVAVRVRPSPDPYDTMQRDIRAVVEVARALGRRPVRLCVYFSSSAVYGDYPSRASITEDTPPSPTSVYGASKLAAEGILHQAAARAAIPLLVLRPCMVYGPGDPSTAYGPMRFIKSIEREGTAVLLGDGSERRNLVFIDDLADWVCSLMSRREEGIFNVTAGPGYSHREVLACLTRVVSKPFTVISVPRDRPAADVLMSSAKLDCVLPHRPITPLAEGLARTWTWLSTRQPHGVNGVDPELPRNRDNQP